MPDPESAPLLSHGLLQQRLLPELDKGEKIFFILIDNFRYDQWLAIKSLVSDLFTYTEDTCFSILPTATQYARNAIFSGLTPLQLSKRFPGLWVGEGEAEGKNLSEELLLRSLLERFNRKERYSYHKISTNAEGEKLVQNFASLERNELNVVVFNFIDMLSHARTESPMIRELAPDEPAYRSITCSWFRHSPLIGLLKKIAERVGRVLLTTDHGTIRVRHPQKVESEKSVNANLRYKVGRNLTYDPEEGVQHHPPGKSGIAITQYQYEIHLRPRRRFLRLPQPVQPLRLLLRKYVSARRCLDGGDDCAIGDITGQIEQKANEYAVEN